MGREPLSILIAVEELDVAHAIVDALSEDEHDVKLAYDADAVLAIANTVPIDCVLLDALLPGAHSSDLARTLRVSSLSPLAVIILLTRHPQQQVHDHSQIDLVIERTASADPSVTGLIRYLQAQRRRRARAKGAQGDPPIE